MTDTSTLPFSPLTLAELNTRGQGAREACGFRCANVATDGAFDARDLDYLLAKGAEAAMWQGAAEVRVMAR